MHQYQYHRLRDWATLPLRAALIALTQHVPFGYAWDTLHHFDMVDRGLISDDTAFLIGIDILNRYPERQLPVPEDAYETFHAPDTDAPEPESDRAD